MTSITNLPLSLIMGGRLPVQDSQTPHAWTEASVAISPEGWIEDIRPPASRPSPSAFNATDCTILPGFIDLHVHGCDGHDVMDATPEALIAMSKFMVRHGVTGFYPTTMTAPPSPTLDAVKAVAAIAKDAQLPGARILGVHLEGPYISPKFPGAQPRDFVRAPDLTEFSALLAAGPVKIMTLAPEQPGASALMKMALAHGVTLVMGHTAASYDEAVEAVTRGVTQATHTYNAMTGLHHRSPGVVGAVLSQDSVFAQLIADNIHVHSAAMKVLARCKGPNHTLLITDAIRATGLPPGQYELGGQPVTVQNGECRLADGTLAGSILTMDRALRNFLAAAGWSLVHGWPVTSRAQAQALGIDDEFGTIAPGYRADLVVLDHALAVVATIVGGRLVYVRDAWRIQAG